MRNDVIRKGSSSLGEKGKGASQKKSSLYFFSISHQIIQTKWAVWWESLILSFIFLPKHSKRAASKEYILRQKDWKHQSTNHYIHKPLINLDDPTHKHQNTQISKQTPKLHKHKLKNPPHKKLPPKAP